MATVGSLVKAWSIVLPKISPRFPSVVYYARRINCKCYFCICIQIRPLEYLIWNTIYRFRLIFHVFFLQMYAPPIFSHPSVRTLAFVGFYLMYLVLGAAVFSAIEGPEEAQMGINLRRSRSMFLRKHSCVPGIFFLFILNFAKNYHRN